MKRFGTVRGAWKRFGPYRLSEPPPRGVLCDTGREIERRGRSVRDSWHSLSEELLACPSRDILGNMSLVPFSFSYSLFFLGCFSFVFRFPFFPFLSMVFFIFFLLLGGT